MNRFWFKLPRQYYLHHLQPPSNIRSHLKPSAAVYQHEPSQHWMFCGFKLNKPDFFLDMGRRVGDS